MAEESQVDNTTDDDTTTSVDESGTQDPDLALTPEELLAALKDARREAGGRRRDNRSLKEETAAKLKEYEDWKKSQLSETDRLKADLKEKEDLMKELVREKMQRNVAKATKLDPDLADLLTGETEEEMTKVAKKLVTKLGETKAGTSSTGASGMLAGVRGKPVEGSQKDDPNTLLRALINNGS